MEHKYEGVGIKVNLYLSSGMCFHNPCKVSRPIYDISLTALSYNKGLSSVDKNQEPGKHTPGTG